jgi:hypothetical protein
MYPTAVFGVCLVAVSLVYAVRPERRFVPLLVSSGLLTLFAGGLGFVTGVIKSFGAIDGEPPDRRWIALLGVGESLHNIGLALVLVVFACLAAALGGLRVALNRAA